VIEVACDKKWRPARCRGDDPLCRAASYLTCLLSGFIDRDETGHGDRAAGVAMARGDEFLAVMASLADQIGAGEVRVIRIEKPLAADRPP